jgi:hypothetical protein
LTGIDGGGAGAGADGGAGAGVGGGAGVGAGGGIVGVADVATRIRALASSYAADLPISLQRPFKQVQLMKSWLLRMVWMAHLVVL